uniref:TF-B3 domain-containing protein n=1 Tax=Opuntia streptacantha TaxID=393608 RepID=A0A7C9A1Z5_OPUST
MEKNKPYFFKLAIGDYIKERLKIPQLFVKKLSADTPNEAIMRVTIKGVAGQRPIMLRKRIDGTYLEDGWEKVVKDNFLGDHEFLLFRYDGDMCFNLQIFEKNGCERIKAPSASEEDKNQQKLFTESDCLESSPKATDDREINAARTQSRPSPTPNPYFTIHMKEYHVKRVYIVGHLCSEFLQAFVRSIFLYLDQRWSPSEILKVKVGK